MRKRKFLETKPQTLPLHVLPVNMCCNILAFLSLKEAILNRTLNKLFSETKDNKACSWTCFNPNTLRAVMACVREHEKKLEKDNGTPLSTAEERLRKSFMMLQPFVFHLSCLWLPFDPIPILTPGAYDYEKLCPKVTSLLSTWSWSDIRESVRYPRSNIKTLQCEVSDWSNLKEIMELHPGLSELRVSWSVNSAIHKMGWSLFVKVPSLSTLKSFSMPFSKSLLSVGEMQMCTLKSLDIRTSWSDYPFSGAPVDTDFENTSVFSWLRSPVLESLVLGFSSSAEKNNAIFAFGSLHPLPALPELRHLEVHKESFNIQAWNDILEECPNLESLEIHLGDSTRGFCSLQDVSNATKKELKFKFPPVSSFRFTMYSWETVHQKMHMARLFLWTFGLKNWRIEMDICVDPSHRKYYTFTFWKTSQLRMTRKKMEKIKKISCKMENLGESSVWEEIKETKKLVYTVIEEDDLFLLRFRGFRQLK